MIYILTSGRCSAFTIDGVYSGPEGINLAK